MAGDALQIDDDGKMRVRSDRVVVGGETDPCCCDDPDCCDLLCGYTPTIISVDMTLMGDWFDWFNFDAPESFRRTEFEAGNGFPHRIFEFRVSGSFPAAHDIQFQGQGTFDVIDPTAPGSPELFTTHTGCLWLGNIPYGEHGVTIEGRKWTADTGWSSWTDIEAVMGISVFVYRTATDSITAVVQIDFNANGEFDSVAWCFSWNRYRPLAFVGKYVACPMEISGRAFSNSDFAVEGEPYFAPGLVVGTDYDTLGCNREDCTGDCVDEDSIPCPTDIDGYFELLGCVSDPAGKISIICNGVGGGINDWDVAMDGWVLFYEGIFLASEDYGNNSLTAITIDCSVNADGPPTYILQFRGPSPPNYHARYEFLGDPVTGLPPTSFSINSGNAAVWDPPPGVTALTIEINCV